MVASVIDSGSLEDERSCGGGGGGGEDFCCFFPSTVWGRMSLDFCFDCDLSEKITQESYHDDHDNNINNNNNNNNNDNRKVMDKRYHRNLP